jgi:hypothetical protein
MKPILHHSKPCSIAGRRSFLRSSAGWLAFALMPGIFKLDFFGGQERSFKFRPYRKGKYAVPVFYITPADGFYLHTFFDICPWSKSQRYFAVTRLPYQQRKPQWGDEAEVCVIDLERQSIRSVYSTRAWAFQLGANIEWSHLSDRYLYCNDLINGQPVTVQIDLEANTVRAFAGSKYHLAPDDASVISPNLLNMNMTQYGYSVPDPPSGKPVPFTSEELKSEGLWHTNLLTNHCSLLASFPSFVAAAEEKSFYGNATLYLFHSKFNKQNTRILQVLRAQINNQGRNASLFTLNTDGSGIIQCLNKQHWNYKAKLGGSGNHPNWHPDGEHVIMNCVPRWLGYENMQFCQFKYDGSDFKLLSEKHLGSGHPSLDPQGRYLLADAYPKQLYVLSENNEIPTRLIDVRSDEELILCSVANDVGGKGKQYLAQNKEEGGSEYKLDPHPAWSHDGKLIAFNGAPEGNRQVFIADCSKLLKG